MAQGYNPNQIKKEKREQLAFDNKIGLCCINLAFHLRLIHQYNFKMNKPAANIYRTTNWSSYNKELINRGNISIWFDPKTEWYAQSQGKQG